VSSHAFLTFGTIALVFCLVCAVSTRNYVHRLRRWSRSVGVIVNREPGDSDYSAYYIRYDWNGESFEKSATSTAKRKDFELGQTVPIVVSPDNAYIDVVRRKKIVLGVVFSIFFLAVAVVFFILSLGTFSDGYVLRP
jgi:hypothetical protein